MTCLLGSFNGLYWCNLQKLPISFGNDWKMKNDVNILDSTSHYMQPFVNIKGLILNQNIILT